MRKIPLILLTTFALFWKILPILDPVSIKATNTYQQASISPAVIPIKPVSVQPESGWTKWLNIARKNKAIFGFRRDIKNPSLAPLRRVPEPVVLVSFC